MGRPSLQRDFKLKAKVIVRLGTLLILVLIFLQFSAFAQNGGFVAWKDALKQKPDWYSSPEAIRIAAD